MTPITHRIGIAALASGLCVAAAALAQAQAPAAKLDDPTIVAIYDAANTWDIETSALAEKKSHNKDVLALAQTFARDHRAVRQEGRDLAKKLGVKPTPPKDPPLYADHLAAMKRLQAASGAAFDREYAQNEVTYHKAVIDAINTTLLPAIQNAELKGLVTKVAPAFQGHLAAAEQLANKLPPTA